MNCEHISWIAWRNDDIGHAKIIGKYSFVMTKVELGNSNLLQITNPLRMKNSNENLTASELRKSKLCVRNLWFFLLTFVISACDITNVRDGVYSTDFPEWLVKIWQLLK